MTFEVKRSEWVRGASKVSALLVKEDARSEAYPDRKRCCLGFFANACGIPDSALKGSSTPARYQHQDPWEPVSREWDKLTIWSLSGRRLNGELCGNLMACNDNLDITDYEREVELTSLFSELGHTVVFVA